MTTGSIYEQLSAAVRRVAEARQAAADAKALLAEKDADFQARHGVLIALVRESAAYVAEAEAMARTLAEAHFNVTKEKTPVPGVVIKERTTHTITDPDAALAWARLTGVALIPERVDEKALLKVATATPLSFVTTTTAPMVTLSSDLSAALATPAPEPTP